MVAAHVETRWRLVADIAKAFVLRPFHPALTHIGAVSYAGHD